MSGENIPKTPKDDVPFTFSPCSQVTSNHTHRELNSCLDCMHYIFLNHPILCKVFQFTSELRKDVSISHHKSFKRSVVFPVNFSELKMMIYVNEVVLDILPYIYFNCTSFTGMCIFIKNRLNTLHKYMYLWTYCDTLTTYTLNVKPSQNV